MPAASRLGFQQDPIYLVDGTAYLYRSFYAFQSMTRSDGFPTNAVYTLMRMLLKILREEQPKYLAFFLDGRGPTFRNELYEPYKAQREATPEPLLNQMDPARRGVSLLGFKVQVSEGCEADDLIASMAAKYRKERPVVIIASDKDLKQCLAENVVMWDPMSKDDKITTLADFQAETGLAPSQWPDFQALIGDSSDNIPGVPGVGPKTAQKVFSQFGSLEEIRDGLDQLPPALKKKIEPHVEDIFTFRELTRLRTDLCDSGRLDDFAAAQPDARQVAEFFKEFEFRSLTRELAQNPGMLGAQAPGKEETAKKQSSNDGGGQLSLFGAPAPATDAVDAKQLGPDALPDLAGQTVGLVRDDAGFHLGLKGDKEFLLPQAHAQDLAAALCKAETVRCPDVKSLLRSHAAWFDVPLAVWFDLSLAAYLLNPEERTYAWDALKNRFGPELDTHPDNAGLTALAMGQVLAERTQGAQLADLMRDLETPLIPVLAHMEDRGMAIDKAAFAAFLDEVQKRLDSLTAKIQEAAGGPFNLRSSQQLAEVLFDKLGLKPAGKTPGGLASTSVTVLEKLLGQHDIIEHILEFRKLEKLRSTYLDPLPKLVGQDGRLRTTFNQLATATGRLSSSNPNLQNIPIRGDMGRRMRSCFTAQGRNLLVAADYSQIELRVLAHMSKDPALLQAFRDGVDIHSRTAALLYDKDQGQVSEDERRNAKTVNFGLIYGMGPQKLGQELKVTLGEAKEFIERYFSKLSVLKEFYEQVQESARELGHVTTLAGRRRLLPEITSRNAQMQALAKRQAVNTLIQGSAADIIKMAMLRVDADQALQSLDARLILQVHDELLLEVARTDDGPDVQDTAHKAGERLAAIMCGVVELAVPLHVDWGAGRTWADAH